MRYPNDILQIVLNYDTNEQRMLKPIDRIRIHQALSYRMTYGVDLDIDQDTSIGIMRTLQEINRINYKPVDCRYSIDRDSGKLTEQKIQ